MSTDGKEHKHPDVAPPAVADRPRVTFFHHAAGWESGPDRSRNAFPLIEDHVLLRGADALEEADAGSPRFSPGRDRADSCRCSRRLAGSRRHPWCRADVSGRLRAPPAWPPPGAAVLRRGGSACPLNSPTTTPSSGSSRASSAGDDRCRRDSLVRRSGFPRGRIEPDEARLLALDPTLDLEAVRTHLAAIPVICKGGPEAGPIGDLPPRGRFRWLVSPRSTVIRMSAVHTGRTSDPPAASSG